MTQVKKFFDLKRNTATAVTLSSDGEYAAYLHHNYKVVNIVDPRQNKIIKQIKLKTTPSVLNIGLLWIGRFLVVFTYGECGFLIYDSTGNDEPIHDVNTTKLIRDVDIDDAKQRILLTLFDMKSTLKEGLSEIREYDLESGNIISSCKPLGITLESSIYCSDGILALGSAYIDNENIWSTLSLDHSFNFQEHKITQLNLPEPVSISGKKLIRYAADSDTYALLLPFDDDLGGYEHHCYINSNDDWAVTYKQSALIDMVVFDGHFYVLANSGLFLMRTFALYDMASGERVHKGSGDAFCINTNSYGIIIGASDIWMIQP